MVRWHVPVRRSPLHMIYDLQRDNEFSLAALLRAVLRSRSIPGCVTSACAAYFSGRQTRYRDPSQQYKRNRFRIHQHKHSVEPESRRNSQNGEVAEPRHHRMAHAVSIVRLFG